MGAAARELLIAQPSASQRLAALERRCGVRLFDRDTTGARPTAAGEEMVENARHILGHLEQVFERSRAAADSDTISVGTFASLAILVFPALHVALPHLRTSQVTDHGPRLVEWVAEGSLDAAFVAIAGQMELPEGVTHQVVGMDPLAMLAPATCDLRSAGRRQLTGRVVVTYTIDHSGEELDRRLVALGAIPNRAATAETGVRLGRMLGNPVVLPAPCSGHTSSKATASWPRRSSVAPPALVTAGPAAPFWLEVLPVVRRELGLARPARSPS